MDATEEDKAQPQTLMDRFKTNTAKLTKSAVLALDQVQGIVRGRSVEVRMTARPSIERLNRWCRLRFEIN